MLGDSARRLPPLQQRLAVRQDTLVVPSMQAKVDAQIAGPGGGGYLANWFAAEHLREGRLVSRQLQEPKPPGPTVLAGRAVIAGAR